MARVICFANQKGGVGKTSTCVNLCAAIHEKNRSILLIDADPQGNATTGMGVDKHRSPTLYDVISGTASIDDAIVSTPYADVLPTNLNLSGASVELVDAPDREQVLKRTIEPVRDRYEYIFIDCPPSLGLLTLNALVASDGIIIPVQCEYYAMEGLADLVTSMKRTKKRFNPDLQIEGILLTMYDRRLSFAAQVASEIRKYFGKAVYSTVVPRNVRIAEAPSHGKPVGAYSRMSRGSTAYDCLAIEFFRHNHTYDI
ncbi:MAG: ParA family protein [Oscillospiraceae bacterium]